MGFLKEKYIGVLLININGIRIKIKSKRFNPLEPTISFKNETFEIDIRSPVYKNNNRNLYFFEKGHGQIFVEHSDLSGREAILKALFKDKLVAQLVTVAEHLMTVNITIIIIAIMSLLGGMGLGFIIHGFIGP